jgi:hypothetical protein
VVGELFKMMAGVDMVQVPFRGAPAAQTALFSDTEKWAHVTKFAGIKT